MSKQWRIAIVVQRYGEEVNGGAEAAARMLAERLAQSATVQVITTCAIDYTTWASHYPAGKSMINGVQVHRFAVDAPRDWPQWQKQSRHILQYEHTLFDEFEWVKTQGPYATALFEHIQSVYHEADIFLFFTYHYATTYFGLPLVSDKAILISAAHDDPYLPLPVFRSIFHLPQALVYLTEPERDLVQSVTRNRQRPSMIAGVGIDTPADVSGARFQEKFNIEQDFLLYVGRIHESKNVPELLDYFLRFRERSERPLKLVLVGRSHLEIPDHPDLIYLGFLSDADKFDAIAAATLVLMPSRFESLSIIILEAWALGKPVLVNGRCAVLRHQCRRSKGGLYYTGYEEFEATLQRLLAAPALRSALGRNGSVFVNSHYRWDVIVAQYRAFFDQIFGPAAT